MKNFNQALWALLDGPGYGMAIAEIMFDVSMGQVSAIEIKDRPQELFTFNPWNMPQNGPLRYLSDRLPTIRPAASWYRRRSS
jgi:hypothetical protein